MMRADEFRSKAEEYFDRAQASLSPWTKSLLLIIADDYLNMAIQAETTTVRAQYPKAHQVNAVGDQAGVRSGGWRRLL
jgi:hypothetical protein